MIVCHIQWKPVVAPQGVRYGAVCNNVCDTVRFTDRVSIEH